jgi:hypothetical protein
VKRAHLEHIIRAASTIADDDEIVVIGSQSLLAQFPDAPDDLLVSVEADVYPKNFPERTDLIDGSIGEGSPFHETFGYYAQGVGEETATLPRGARDRLVRIQNPNTRGATGWCLEIHDLVISKAVAGRAFLASVARHKLAETSGVWERFAQTNLDEHARKVVRDRLTRAFGPAP